MSNNKKKINKNLTLMKKPEIQANFRNLLSLYELLLMSYFNYKKLFCFYNFCLFFSL